MYQKWTEERIESDLRRAVEELHLDRIPSKEELFRWSGDNKLGFAIARNGGYKYWADKLDMDIKIRAFDREYPAAHNPQCEKCFATKMGRCMILIKPEAYPCFAFKTEREAEASREKAMRRLKDNDLTYLLDLYNGKDMSGYIHHQKRKIEP